MCVCVCVCVCVLMVFPCLGSEPISDEYKGRMKDIGVLLHKLLSSSDSKVGPVYACVCLETLILVVPSNTICSGTCFERPPVVPC